MIEQERLENLQTLEEIKTVSQTEITFSLGDLNGIVIEAQQDYRKKNTNNSQNRWNDLWINYLENDPDNFFKNKIYRDRDGQLCPECNNHVVLQRILLNDFREGTIITQAHYKTWYNKLKLLENEFNVSVDTLYSNLRHSERPHTIINYCLGFAVTFGFNNDTLKENIEYDGDRFLRNNYLRNYELCNSQWLAQHRLPCFVEVLKNFNDLITLLAAKEKRYSKLKPYQIENHWFKHTLPRLGQLASRLIYNL